MAERRMFAKSVIGSARFLRMPSSSRLLYYDLGMQADDDGVVEAFSVMRTTGATEDDLRVLASKGFVVVLNEDLVTYISDWGRNNLIKRDRYHPSIYQDLLVKINDGTIVEPEWNPSGTQTEPEVRLGKERIDEDSLGGGKNSSAIAAAIFAYREKINPTPSQTCLAELESFAETMGIECCMRAFDIALDNKKTAWSYIRAILQDKQHRGVKCLADWDALEEAWKNKGGKNNGSNTGDLGQGIRIGNYV